MVVALIVLCVFFGMIIERHRHDAPLSNDEITNEVNRCTKAGLDMRYASNSKGMITAIQCRVPDNGRTLYQL